MMLRAIPAEAVVAERTRWRRKGIRHRFRFTLGAILERPQPIRGPSESTCCKGRLARTCLVGAPQQPFLAARTQELLAVSAPLQLVPFLIRPLPGRRASRGVDQAQ